MYYATIDKSQRNSDETQEHKHTENAFNFKSLALFWMSQQQHAVSDKTRVSSMCENYSLNQIEMVMDWNCVVLLN